MNIRDVPSSGALASEGGATSLEPARLRSDGPAFARRLIESASADEVPEASLLRLADVLNLTGEALRNPAPARTRVARFGSPRLVGGLGTAGLVGAIVAAAWVGLNGERSRPAEPRATEAAARERAAIENLPSTAERSEGPQLFERAAPEPPSRTEPAPPHSAPRSVRAARGTAPRAAAPLRDLHAELEALEAVQGALSAQRTSDAARLLADYRRRFPDGELTLEAELLRIEVSIGRGEPARALAVAERLLARPDMDRYRARLEALQRAAKKQLAHAGEQRETIAPTHTEKAAARGQKPGPLDMDAQEETR